MGIGHLLFWPKKIAGTATRIFVIAVIGALSLTGCHTIPTESTVKHEVVTVITHNSFHVSEDLIKDFQRKSGLEVEVVKAGYGATLVSNLTLNKADPKGDVVFGLAKDSLSRVSKEGLLQPSGAEIPVGVDKFADEIAPSAVPIDHGDVCVNIDTDYFKTNNIPEPVTFEDLAQPAYKNLMVVPNATDRSTGAAFLVGTIAHFGDDGWEDYWKQLKTNGTKVVKSWDKAYNEEFTQGKGHGDRPIVVSYSSSPAFTVNEEKTKSSTKSLSETCYKQVEYAGVLSGAKNHEGGRKFIEFMLSTLVQEDIPHQMYMYPVVPEAQFSEEMLNFALPAENSLQLPAKQVEASMDDWLHRWADIIAS